MFRIAEAVGRPVYELEDMPVSEQREWLEWFAIKAEREKKAHEDAKAKAKAAARGRRR